MKNKGAKKMKLQEKILIKILALIARIVGYNVDGFYSHELNDIINQLDQKDEK